MPKLILAIPLSLLLLVSGVIGNILAVPVALARASTIHCSGCRRTASSC